MRINFITYSSELNDAMLEAYSHYVYLLGRDNDQGTTTYSGAYDIWEQEIKNYNENYVILRNDYVLEGYEYSVPRYLDTIHYKITHFGR